MQDDMSRFYELSSDLRSKLPPWPVNSTAWLIFIEQQPEAWKHMAADAAFMNSCIDPVDESQHGGCSVDVKRYVCNVCTSSTRPAFSSEKALSCHMRVLHGMRSPIKQYVDGSGICRICLTNFRTRIRVISHLSDKRRPRCRDRLLSGDFEPLPADVQKDLDDRDRVIRREAVRSGHTHPIASGCALTFENKRIGHVSS